MMQADALGILASRLNKEMLARHMRIQFHDQVLNRAPSDTTYNMLTHRFKTVWVTALNRKASMNLRLLEAKFLCSGMT